MPRRRVKGRSPFSRETGGSGRGTVPARARYTEAMAFLPTTRAELAARKLDGVDFVIVTGDAYVDHPSFGAALIGRWLEHLQQSRLQG